MICMQYPVASDQSYMTTELADALTEAGHQVEVLLVDWAAKAGGAVECITSPSGIRVVRCPPEAMDGLGSFAAKSSKFVLTGRRAARVLQEHFDPVSFDVAI